MSFVDNLMSIIGFTRTDKRFKRPLFVVRNEEGGLLGHPGEKGSIIFFFTTPQEAREFIWAHRVSGSWNPIAITSRKQFRNFDNAFGQAIGTYRLNPPLIIDEEQGFRVYPYQQLRQALLS